MEPSIQRLKKYYLMLPMFITPSKKTEWETLIQILYKTVSPKLSFDKMQIKVTDAYLEQQFVLSHYFKEFLETMENELSKLLIELRPLFENSLLLHENKLYIIILRNNVIDHLKELLYNALIKAGLKYYQKLYESKDNLRLHYTEDGIMLYVQDIKKDYRKKLIYINTTESSRYTVLVDDLNKHGMVNIGNATVGIEVVNIKLKDTITKLVFSLGDKFKIKTKKDV